MNKCNSIIFLKNNISKKCDTNKACLISKLEKEKTWAESNKTADINK